ncbi:hypothetical protein [Oceaniglobus trochenteri]|uniref:hypothetical protein n=1 Tax=Oceaniglobus trochenteri TaxID=2763260 RepID=UPI001CFFF638|nr:hypothetical protein [Oceaniglobus trochenteri]
MPTRLFRHAIALLALCVPGVAQAEAPLSAIDWLSDSVILPAPVALPRRVAPERNDIATSALPEEVTVRPLDRANPDTVGLVPARRAGLPADLWGASSSDSLARLLAAQDAPELSALRDLLKAMLTAELDPPDDSVGNTTLFLARIDALLALGALDEAAEMLDRAGRTEPIYFRRWFDISLLNGTEDRACARMRALPQISPTYAARIFCLARGGDWQAAALTLDTAEALGLIKPEEDELLGRFLLAELSDNAPPLPFVRNPSPLVFSMYAAVGEPISTQNLPIAFAHSDLRPINGWKARIAAAERLARVGALSGARLLEIYSEREPAASGGVWDRVEAVQTLARAINDEDGAAVSATLPTAWREMQDNDLEVPFAEAIAEAIDPLPLSGAAVNLQLRIGLLSTGFAAAAARARADTPQQAFWLALAQGEAHRTTPPDALSGAIRDGFRDQKPPERLQALLDEDRRGEAVLQAITLFARGADGNLDELQHAIAVLRAVGLTEQARRAALHLLILGPEG